DLHHLTGLPALFDTLLVYENYPLDDDTDTHHDLALTSVDIHDSTHYPLTLGILPTPTHITIELSYQPHRITHHTITTLTTLLDTALHTLATAPHTRIAELPLLTDHEREHLARWSTGASEPAAGTTLDTLIRNRTTHTPNAIAVTDDSRQQWTYTTLDSRANALAHILFERGVQVGDRVAVMLPRSVDLVTALLAVIRVGAAYVPIDPDYPSERIGHILDDSTPSLLITTTEIRTNTRATNELHLDNPDIAARLDTGHTTAPTLDRPLTPADTAYVIFTSGTTGRPKGVMIS
ncbi:AMP-binding protein, partial [Rhodococcoides fascians]|uniref:AMP-binding protein n=2 Tax=Nocardiaceae TaxID=85025 RepID=UPI0018B01372